MFRVIWAAVLLLIAISAQASEVKLSRSGICHDQSSSSYQRTQNYTAYADLAACLDAGGRLPKGQHRQSVAQRSPGYSRAQFGSGWADLNGDCRNARSEALIAQSTAPVKYKSERECQVQSGRWISPYSGSVIYTASDIDIDHVVPLRLSWKYGAEQWTKQKRIAFANDPANLLSVEASLNRQKGAKGLTEWLPPSNQCQYILRFMRVSRSYGLDFPPAKLQQHQQLKQRYCTNSAS